MRSPALCNFEETLSTVRYANRAKAIKVSAKKNDEQSQIGKLQGEVRREAARRLHSGRNTPPSLSAVQTLKRSANAVHN